MAQNSRTTVWDRAWRGRSSTPGGGLTRTAPRAPVAPLPAATRACGRPWDVRDTVVSTRYWHALPDARIQCDVCPRACKLHEGQQGLCFVRARRNDRIVLTSYGRSSGFCIDPIEKKPLNHYLPGTPILSFGTA